MEAVQRASQGSRPRRLRIGVLDLVSKKPTRTYSARIVRPNYSSVMPQTIAVWAEQMGHEVRYVTYTGLEDLQEELPREVDILFVCAFTSAAYLAYSISNLCRQQGIVTVLGGPHARSYGDDARRHFDYVVGFADRALVQELLHDFGPQRGEGVRLSAERHPETLPGVRERWKYIQHNLGKTRLLHVVPMISSLGCPYKCDFCIDSRVEYQPLADDLVREDLLFVQEKLRHPLVAWHDPNFGIGFDARMATIEEVVQPGAVRFIAESTLSVLTEPHLRRLQRNGFVGVVPGIESWFEYGGKAGQGKRTGLDKVQAVAEHVEMVSRYIPFIQANLMVGLDGDSGPEPFELTKRFVDLAPSAMPTYRLFTMFGNAAPLASRLQEDGRVLDMPFHLLDTNSTLNVKLKNYTSMEFYEYLADLIRYTFSPGLAWRRFTHKSHSLLGATRWIQLIRSKGILGKGRYAYYRKMADMLATDAELSAFCAGESTLVPAYYRNRIRADLGVFYQHLPPEVRHYLDTGQRTD